MKKLIAFAACGLLLIAAAANAAKPAPKPAPKKPAAVKAATVKAKPKPKANPAPKAAVAPTKIEVGSTPPPLKVWKWVKGEPVTKLEAGKIYVIEFWATWCPPCKESIPHLTELAHKYKDKITFAGIDVADSTDMATMQPYTSEKPYADNVAKFVKDMGDKMDYSVGQDSLKGTLASTWMEAAGVQSIPMAFVIGADGKIAAIVHPMELDGILDDIIAGKFDPAALAKKQADDKAEQEKFQKDFSKVNELYQQKEYQKCVEEIDRVLANNPKYEEKIATAKFDLMTKYDETAAYAYARKLGDSLYKDNAQGLDQLAFMMVANKELKTPDYDLGLSLAEKANELTKGENAPALDTLAVLYAQKGNFDKAIEFEQKAADVVAKDDKIPQNLKDAVNKRLEDYKNQKNATK